MGSPNMAIQTAAYSQLMSQSYRATWASRKKVLLPRVLRRVSGGVWIYGSVGTPGLLGNQITGLLAGGSIALVPGVDVKWEPPMGPQLFADWLDRVSEILKARVSGWVIQLPADRRRRRFNLLALDTAGTPVAFAKFSTNPPNPLTLAALKRFETEPTKQFWSPVLLASERVGDFEVVVSTAMPNRPHAPAFLSPVDRRAVLLEMQDRLSDLVSPQVFTHGDFAPWNVRRFRNGVVAVIDWEETMPGVELADELWFVVCHHAWKRSDVPAVMEDLGVTSRYHKDLIARAAQFWLDRLRRPEKEEININIAVPNRVGRFAVRVRSLLEAMR